MPGGWLRRRHPHLVARPRAHRRARGHRAARCRRGRVQGLDGRHRLFEVIWTPAATPTLTDDPPTATRSYPEHYRVSFYSIASGVSIELRPLVRPGAAVSICATARRPERARAPGGDVAGPEDPDADDGRGGGVSAQRSAGSSSATRRSCGVVTLRFVGVVSATRTMPALAGVSDGGASSVSVRPRLRSSGRGRSAGPGRCVSRRRGARAGSTRRARR
jgi:hypothetical protein